MRRGHLPHGVRKSRTLCMRTIRSRCPSLQCGRSGRNARPAHRLRAKTGTAVAVAGVAVGMAGVGAVALVAQVMVGAAEKAVSCRVGMAMGSVEAEDVVAMEGEASAGVAMAAVLATAGLPSTDGSKGML
jgi:hypothetical protein